MASPRRVLLVVWLLLLMLTSALAFGGTSPLRGLEEISKTVGFSAYAKTKGTRLVKVAVLDNGFRGWPAEIGKSLPTTTVFHPGPVPVDAATEESHGLAMAQILVGLLDRTAIAYQLHLFSTQGYSNFASAVRLVVEGKFDVVLYSQVWEYGGNGDGQGFINKLVNRATAGGTVWINAAGNFAGLTHVAPVEVGADRWLKLPGPRSSVRVQCASRSGKCPLRVVLSWNDFKDDVNAGTEKDLDLIVSDESLKTVVDSGFQQIPTAPAGGTPKTASLYPREYVQKEVGNGTYLIRVRAQSANFNASRDRLRITASGDGVRLIDATPDVSSVLPPADNPSVITIGAFDSERSSYSMSGKPELVTVSALRTEKGEEFRGSSNAAAIAAAAAVVVKGVSAKANRAEVLRKLTSTRASDPARPDPQPTEPQPPSGGSWIGPGHGLPLTLLQFGPTGPGCFLRGQLHPNQPPPAHLTQLLDAGAVVVQTTAGIKIFTALDPFYQLNITRFRLDDMLLVDGVRFLPAPRQQQWSLPPGVYEVAELPQGQYLCRDNVIPPPTVQPPQRPQPQPGPRTPLLQLPAPPGNGME